jgi:predicted membrane protein
MKRVKEIVIGVIVVLLGILLLLKSLGIIENFNIFFDGWWTLFIIIPAIIGFISDKDKTTDLIALIVGVLLLLGARDIVSYKMIGKLILPIIVIIIGLSLIFTSLFKPKVMKNIEETDKEGRTNYTTIFAGQEHKITNEYKGSNITAIFGGVDLDLRKAKIKEDIIIKPVCIFGGADIFLPEDVKVKITSSSIFGGVEDKRTDTSDEGKQTVYIEAVCIFGGVDIK